MTPSAAGLAGVVALTVASAAQAMSIREWRGLEQVEPAGALHAQYYLIGVLEGLREAAEQAVREGVRPPFCVAGRRLEPRMALSLYQAELRRNATIYEADMPVQFVLSQALRNSYPCN
jgi:hypothetical protein